MAENDDEDGFGDFKFASSNGPIANEDDWGEFTDSRFRTPARSLPAENSNIFANGSVVTQSLTDQGRVGPKAGGAIPLSIFGEEEIEEEGSGIADGSFATGTFSGPKKFSDLKDRVSDLNDLVANLYKQGEKSKDGNGSISGFTGSDVKNPTVFEDNKADSIVNGQIQKLDELDVSFNGSSNANFRSNGSDSFWIGFSSSSNELDASNRHAGMEAMDRKEDNLTVHVSGLAPNVFGSNKIGLVSEGSDSTLAPGSGEVDQDDGGWEFKDAEFTAKHGGENFELRKFTTGFIQFGHHSDIIASICLDRESIFHFSFPNSCWTKLGSDIGGLKSNLNGVTPKENGLSSSSGDQNEELSDDDGWEFKVAESGHTQGYDGTKVEEIVLENSKGAGSTSGFSVNISTDLFSTSGQISGQPGEWDFGFGLLSSSPIENQPVDTENKSFSSLDDKNIKLEKASYPLENIYSENESKDKGNQTNDGEYVEHKGALPLSIFGDENLEIDVPLDSSDVSMHKPTYVKPCLNVPASNISITDIISSLYGRSEQTDIRHAHNPIENGFSLDDAVVSNLVDDGDGLDDDSWEFKDVISESNSENQKPVPNSGNSQLQFSSKSKINDFKDFYSKLKSELCLITLSHLDNMKETRGFSAFNEDAEVNTLEKEIQDLYEEQYKHRKVSQENLPEGQPKNNFSVGVFSTALQEERFQVLEAEYQLSDQLSRVEKDVKSATELLKHAVSMLEILKVGSSEELSNYVCTWYNILSACVRELKHAAFIWTQSLQKNISSLILSKPQGKQYMIALGEIFRVVEIIECSAKLYKPWILSSSSDPPRVIDLLKECSTLWSSSGIEEALKTLSDPADTEYDGTIKDLLQSIKKIHDLDAHELYDQVFSGKQPTCHLSGLPLETIPGMKVVAWEGEDYFLKLANFWANLISHDPPNLPQILANR